MIETAGNTAMNRNGEMRRELAANDATPLYAGVKQIILDRIHSALTAGGARLNS